MTHRFCLRNFRNTTFAFFTIGLLNGCLSDEEGASLFNETATQVNLSGSVGDGPIVGADMAVISIDNEQLASFQSDASAGYSVSFEVHESSYPLMVMASGGTDLVTGASPDFELSSATFGVANSGVANVNPYSTIAVALARSLPGGMTADNLANAENIVSSALNSGLSGLATSGPIGTQIDESNVSEIVKASETLAEVIRRTRDLLQGGGFSTDGDRVVNMLAADLTDSVVDGIGAANTDRRAAAVSTIVTAQVLLESMANELRVNGSDATNSMRNAIEQVTVGTPTISIEQLGITSEMIAKTRIGLAAAFEVDPDPAIRQLHTVVSSLSAGQNSTLVRVALPSNYRSRLQNALAAIPNADDALIDIVNAIARSNGDIDAGNLAPTIQGVPTSSATVGAPYSFTPSASDPNGDTLTFEIANKPSWASFEALSGTLSGTPGSDDVGTYASIVISVFDGDFKVDLPAFTIAVTVTPTNTAPTISGTAPSTVAAGNNYSFAPVADDEDGDQLTFSIDGQPSWTDFDSTTGRLSGVPAETHVGSYTGIIISVTDGQLMTSLAPFAITVSTSVTNSPPQISGTAPTTVNADESYSFTPTASDSDGDALSFVVSGLPSWASFDTSTGQISGTPSAADVGTYSGIAITVSDGQASASLSAFSIVVQSISLGSVTVSWTAPTENEDGSTLTDLVGYRLYWGTSPGSYPNSAPINNASVTSLLVENLSPGTYTFVATSINSSGLESSYSESVTKVIP